MNYTTTSDNDRKYTITQAQWNALNSNPEFVTLLNRYDERGNLSYSTPTAREDGYVLVYNRILRVAATSEEHPAAKFLAMLGQ